MIEEYKLTKEAKGVYYYKILLRTLAIVLVVFIGYKYYDNITDRVLLFKILLGIIWGWFLIFGLPLFLLYFNHKKYSKGVILKQEGNRYTYANKSESIKFSIDDIAKIELWLTPPAYDERIDWQYFGKYHFTRIYTKENKIINLSCLVFDKTKEVFPEELIKRKKKFFPFMKKNEI